MTGHGTHVTRGDHVGAIDRVSSDESVEDVLHQRAQLASADLWRHPPSHVIVSRQGRILGYKSGTGGSLLSQPPSTRQPIVVADAGSRVWSSLLSEYSGSAEPCSAVIKVMLVSLLRRHGSVLVSLHGQRLGYVKGQGNVRLSALLRDMAVVGVTALEVSCAVEVVADRRETPSAWLEFPRAVTHGAWTLRQLRQFGET